jgi:methyltransferase (TIGR00027 family)
VTSVADTARIVAHYRAVESERADAVFHDPHAARLAGDEGRRLARLLPAWEIPARIVIQRVAVFDELLMHVLARTAPRVGTVLNLGAGFDTRPFRLPLPSNVRWLDLDVEPIIEVRRRELAGLAPRCRVESIALDVSNAAARRELFDRVESDSTEGVLVVSEGLLVYLEGTEVAELARDLIRRSRFAYWLLDLMSPFAVVQMARAMRRTLGKAYVPLTKFAPRDGAGFFEPLGWKMLEYREALAEARRIGRPVPIPPALSLLSRFVSRFTRTDGTVLFGRS